MEHMKLFRRRETLIENITFMAIASALVGLFALAGSFSIIASLVLMLVIPLLSSLVAYICKWRYLPLYLVASVIVSFLLSFASFQNEILFVIPSILVGLAYGMLERSKLDTSIALFVCALIEFGLFYLSIAIIKGIYEIDMVAFLLQMVGRGIDGVSEIIFPTFVFAYAFAQTAIMHLFHEIVFSRFKEERKFERFSNWVWTIGATSSILSFAFAFIYAPLAYIFFAISLYWSAFALVPVFQKPSKIPMVLLVGSIFLTVIISAILYRAMPKYTGIIAYGFFMLFACLVSFLNHLLLRKKN